MAVRYVFLIAVCQLFFTRIVNKHGSLNEKVTVFFEMVKKGFFVPTLLNDSEIQALYGLDHFVFRLYVCVLRRNMNYSTGIVGEKPRRISLREMCEALYIEPRRGVDKNNTGTPHESKVRRALESLKDNHIVEQIINPQYLIFKLPYAAQGKSVQKQADTNLHAISDANLNQSKPIELRANNKNKTQADIYKNDQADTPQISGKSNTIKEKPTLRVGKKKCLVSDQFVVTEHHVQLARENDWPNPHDEIDAFRDFHISRGTPFADVDRGFYTWLRNAKKFKTQKEINRNGLPNHSTPQNSISRTIDNIANARKTN